MVLPGYAEALKALSALSSGNKDAIQDYLPALAKSLKVDSASLRSVVMCSLDAATIEDNVDAIDLLAQKLGVDPGIARAFVCGNCESTVPEMARALEPMCRGLSIEKDLAAALVLSINWISMPGVEFDIACFDVFCKCLGYEERRLEILYGMHAVAIGLTPAIKRYALPLAKAFGFVAARQPDKGVEKRRSQLLFTLVCLGKSGRSCGVIGHENQVIYVWRGSSGRSCGVIGDTKTT